MAFTHIQGAHAGTGNTGGSTIAATGSAVGSGNTVVGIVTWAGATTTTLSSVKDNQSNTYTVKDTVPDTSNDQAQASFVLGNITNGPVTITATFSNSTVFRTIIWDEYSGAAALSDPTDGHTGQLQPTPGTGTDAVKSGNITTTVNGDLIYGGTIDTSAATLASSGTGFTSRTSDTVGAACITEDMTQATAGLVAATFTVGTSVACATFVIAVKAPSAGDVLASQIWL